MAKIRPLSDLHLEFHPIELAPAGEDVIVLAGDIDIGVAAIHQAEKIAVDMGVPVVFVPGNHEFYTRLLPAPVPHSTVLAEMAEVAAASQGRVVLLDDDLAMVAGVRFIGSTLWTDYALHGAPVIAKLNAHKWVNDYRNILLASGARLRPDIVQRWHQTSVIGLWDFLAEPFTPTVVVTHMAPSGRSIGADYAGDRTNPCFASHLDDLVNASRAALWVHGHIHSSSDYMIGGTRVICNPRGYLPHQPNRQFNPNLVVEV